LAFLASVLFYHREAATSGPGSILLSGHAFRWAYLKTGALQLIGEMCRFCDKGGKGEDSILMDRCI